MKATYSYLSLAILFPGFAGLAQSITWGSPFTTGKGDIVHSIEAEDGNLFHVTRTSCCNDYYSAPLSYGLTPQEKVEIYSSDEKAEYEKLLLKKGMPISVQVLEKPDSGMIIAYGAIQSIASGKPIISKELVKVSIPEKKTRPLWSAAVSDNAKVFTISALQPFDPGSKAAIELWVFNDSLMKLHHQTLKLPYERDDFEFMGGAVNDSGVVFFAGKTGTRLNSPFRRKYILFSYNPISQEIREFSLSPENVYLRDVVLDINLAGEMHVVASYGKDPFDEGQSMGLSHIAIDSDGKTVLAGKLFPYQTNVKNESTNLGIAGSEHLVLLKLLFMEGGPVAVLEKQFRDQICTTDPRTGIVTCTDQYNFDEIKLVALGTSKWKELNIPKKQTAFTDRDPHFSVYSTFVEGSIYLLYNEHHKNEFPAIQARSMSNPSRSIPLLVSISPEGTIDAVPLSSERQSDFALQPEKSFEADGHIILTSESNREQRHGKLVLQGNKP